MAGIVGYGAYVPNLRLRVEDIWEAWTDPIETTPLIKKKRGLTEKAVGRWDEDAITMAIYAAKSSLAMAGISGGDLSAIYWFKFLPRLPARIPFLKECIIPIFVRAGPQSGSQRERPTPEGNFL